MLPTVLAVHARLCEQSLHCERTTYWSLQSEFAEVHSAEDLFRLLFGSCFIVFHFMRLIKQLADPVVDLCISCVACLGLLQGALVHVRAELQPGLQRHLLSAQCHGAGLLIEPHSHHNSLGRHPL